MHKWLIKAQYFSWGPTETGKIIASEEGAIGQATEKEFAFHCSHFTFWIFYQMHAVSIIEANKTTNQECISINCVIISKEYESHTSVTRS